MIRALGHGLLVYLEVQVAITDLTSVVIAYKVEVPIIQARLACKRSSKARRYHSKR